MGLVGDLLYPDNPDLAREANKDQQKLQKTHDLHNQLVTAYREMAEDIRTFDSYLMSILVMQYYFVYEKEDLTNMPATKVPQITQSLADKIESIALDALSIKMGYNGIKAIYNRLANVTREGGTFRANIDDIDEAADAISEELTPEIDSAAAQSDIVSSANVDMLTNTELTAEQLTSYASELGEATESIDTIAESGELSEVSELPDIAKTASTGIEATTEVIEGTEAAAEAAAEAGVEAAAASATVGAAAILGPAIIIVIVVTEIFSAIEAGQTHEKLEKALKQLRKMQKQADKSVASLKKAFKSLLKGGKADIKAYNQVLKKLYQLETNSTFNNSFTMEGFTSFINALENITVDNSDGIDGYQSGVTSDLHPALDFIRHQAINDSSMMEVISIIRTHIKKYGSGSITDAYLKSISIDLDMDLSRIHQYNKFRAVLNDIASALAPYHKQIQDQTPAGAKKPTVPSNPSFGKYDPNFQLHPSQFQIPKIGGSNV